MQNLLVFFNPENTILVIIGKVLKEKQFQRTIDDAVRLAYEFGNNLKMPHFIYCFNLVNADCGKLNELFLSKMRIYGIEWSFLTMLYIYRRNLITKEKQNLI